MLLTGCRACTYDCEIVEESTWSIASDAVEGGSIRSCDAQHDDCDDEGNEAYVPEPLEGPRRGLVAGVDVHVERTASHLIEGIDEQWG